MNSGEHYRIIVRDGKGKKVLDWSTPLTGKLIVKDNGSRVVIEKTSWFGIKTYIPSVNESVEARG